MSLLSVATEKQLENVLISNKMITKEKYNEAKAAADVVKQPLMSYMVKKGYITDEQLTKANAQVTKIPYVNLTNAKIDPAVLKLLPKDIAERYMAVPLGEMKKRLVVAMLDADNVQAVDFLSNRIARPLKVYVASEAGIKQVLKQYDARLDTTMEEAFKSASVLPGEDIPKKKKPEVDKSVKTLVEDSPITKALSAILEFAARNRASDVHIE